MPNTLEQQVANAQGYSHKAGHCRDCQYYGYHLLKQPSGIASRKAKRQCHFNPTIPFTVHTQGSCPQFLVVDKANSILIMDNSIDLHKENDNS